MSDFFDKFREDDLQDKSIALSKELPEGGLRDQTISSLALGLVQVQTGAALETEKHETGVAVSNTGVPQNLASADPIMHHPG